MDIRVGFHYGPVLENEDDVFGETVGIAARLCELASPGRALTTSETAARLSRGKQRAAPVAVATLKGHQSADRTVGAEVCDDVGKVTQTAVFGVSPRPGESHELHWALATARTLWQSSPSLSIGRERTCDVPLRDELSSRRHCYIEERNGKFALVDCSSNGTFVTSSDGRTVILHREELVLVDSGWITFGQPRGPVWPN